MKINILFFGIFIGALTRQSIAICQCSEGDTACFQACVDKTNICITSCGSDTVCYNNCIQDSWPGQTLSTNSNNIIVTSTTSQSKSNPTSIITKITPAPTLTSIPTVGPNKPSSIPGGNTVISKPPISNSDRPIPTYPEFSPKPPTSSTAPPATSNSGSKSLLVPGVAIGVAMVTVIVQLFFLARMGTILFHS